MEKVIECSVGRCQDVLNESLGRLNTSIVFNCADDSSEQISIGL